MNLQLPLLVWLCRLVGGGFFVSSWLSLVGLKLGVDISLCFPFYVTGFGVHHRYLVVSCLYSVASSLRELAHSRLETM